MINLLPPKEKQLLQKEYRLRLMGSALAFLSALTLIGLIILLPSYMLSYYQRQGSMQKAEAGNGEENAKRTQLINTLAAAKSMAAALAPTATSSEPTNLVDLLTKDKAANDTITAIIYGKDSTGLIKATVQGVADSRESLQAFTEKLQTEPEVASLNLPISNFTKDTDIPYSFDVTLK